MGTSVLSGLGPALRWLRQRHGRKQFQTADTAGVTKGMLSSWETGRQRPSLDSLEKLLDTLGCDLHDLHNALQIVNGRAPVPRGAMDTWGGFSAPGGVGVARALGLPGPLPPEQEQAIQQLLDGFHRLIRYVVLAAQAPAGGSDQPGDSDA